MAKKAYAADNLPAISYSKESACLSWVLAQVDKKDIGL